ncbi:hypothetical protein D9M68_739210 [compost metagenome]
MRVQRQEVRTPVLARLDADVVQAVGQRQFFQGDRGLEAVGRTVGIEVDHCGFRSAVPQAFKKKRG